MPVLNLDETSQALFQPGSGTGSVTLINLSDTDTAYVATTPTVHITDIPVGPLATMTFDGTQWWYGSAVSGPLVQVAVLTGTTGYGAGSLTISGPVTAEITGPVEVEGSVEISGTPTVAIDGTVEVAGSVDISGTPTVAISGTVAVDAEITNSSIDITTAAPINVSAATVDVSPLATSTVLETQAGVTIGAGANVTYSMDVAPYNSISGSLVAYNTSQATAGAALTGYIQFVWYDTDGNILDLDAYYFWILDSSTTSPPTGMFTFNIPCKGVTCDVQIANNGSAGTVTLKTLDISGSNRSFPQNLVNQYMNTNTVASSAGITTVAAEDNVYAGIISYLTADALTDDEYVFIPLPMLAGPVSIYFGFDEDTTNDTVLCAAQNLEYGNITTGTGNLGVMWNINTTTVPTPGVFTTTLYLPAAPCYLVMRNSATPGYITLTITSGSAS